MIGRPSLLCLMLACVLASPMAEVPALQKAAAKAKEKAEETTVQGIEIGMTLQQAVETIGELPSSKRVGAEAKPPKGNYARPPLDPDGILFWRLPDETILEVGIRKDRVFYVSIQYAKNRRAPEFELPEWSTNEERRWGAELQPPVSAFRVRRTPGSLSDQTRIIWDRREKIDRPFNLEIVLMSPARGDTRSYARQVFSRRVSVMNEDQKKFDAWATAQTAQAR